MEHSFYRNLDCAFHYFQQWKTHSFQNECINIIFLRSVLDPTGSQLSVKELPVQDDYRLDFIRPDTKRMICDPLEMQNITQSLLQLIKRSQWDKACNVFVQYGLHFWRTLEDSTQVFSWCTTVLNLILKQGIPPLEMLKCGKWKQGTENFLYFITHYFLILFQYNYPNRNKVPSLLLTKSAPFLETLLDAWNQSLAYPKKNVEIILEICWILLLIREEQKESFIKEKKMVEKTIDLIQEIPPPKKISKKMRDFKFYHTLYHSSILSLFVLKQLTFAYSSGTKTTTVATRIK